MLAPCAVHVPIRRLPAHVRVIRDGRPVPAAGRPFLERGDEIDDAAPAHFTFSYAGNRYRVMHGRLRLDCRRLLLGSGASPPRATVLAADLRSGEVKVHAGGRARRALILTREMLALATHPGTNYVVDRNPSASRTRAWTLDEPIVTASAADPELRIDAEATYTDIADRHGLRLDVWPFAITRAQRRPAAADGLVPFWDDGRACSVGCRAPGAIPGWPLKPFHQQHALRAGFDELRPANFHIGVDIEAQNGQAVYPIQSGRVQLFDVGTPDEHVQVGQFQYWHIHHLVSPGQYAVAYATELGTVGYNARHVHLSELGPAGQYLNPLRPGGSVTPYTDTVSPVIGSPRVFGSGRVIVGVFDPQSFVQKASYQTPVLAPAALAWRLFSASGHALTGLEWALRATQNYPPLLKPVIFAPGAHNPGFDCFDFRQVCTPTWNYWLAGGLSEALPLDVLRPGRYRLSVYAWDWAGNTSALDDWLTLPLRDAPHAPIGAVVAAPGD